MLKKSLRNLLLPLALALSSCATQEPLPPAPPSVIEAPRAQIEPLDPELARQAVPDFQQRLRNFFSN